MGIFVKLKFRACVRLLGSSAPDRQSSLHFEINETASVMSQDVGSCSTRVSIVASGWRNSRYPGCG